MAVPHGGLAAAEPYKLAAGDQIRVVIPEAPDLSGTYVLGEDGGAAIPIGAPLILEGMSIAQAGDAIRRALEKTLVSPTVMVELAQLRPFFILGDVNNAGPYPARFRLTVVKAVAIAGGFKGQSDPYTATVTGIRASETMQVGARQLLEARVEYARLQAELSGAETFDASSVSATGANAQDLAAVVTRETDIFETRKVGLQRQIEFLAKEAGIRNDEIAALTARIKATDAQLEALKTEIGSTEELVKKELMLRQMIFQLRREEGQVLSTNLQTAVLLNQARQAKTQLEIQMMNISRDRKLEVLDRIKEVNATIERLGRQLSADRAVIVESESSTSPRQQSDVLTTYRITREDGTVLDNISSETEPVLPGDVVEVRRKLADMPQN
ncbi:protein involved in polysaccharide export with SLBB domain [Pararhizobium capsulatum DSM 1112]|uniref:Protein involved in polysaccharide export with SLBB domain n=1 Tax=Pararhizobium capsulatum DSM 1112 TaxID=1121113 RepID=A0ABU0BTT3_9HYPH|nr:polysaccharide biosynthesis/export family protein [Pararhizobium capsulatum]MDQ0321099.1 protein involved in polysaccharide export with SLBB domain [Pararhizobium capsulatum DSM 1112]